MSSALLEELKQLFGKHLKLGPLTQTGRLQKDDRLQLGDRPQPDETIHTDERGLFQSKPLCVVSPDSTQGVSQILSLASQHKVGVVTMGGNTGLCGGAVATPDCILLEMSRMRKVRDKDAANFSLTVEAGMAVAEVAGIADEMGMVFPLRFGADDTAQIGGAISTNAGGVGVLRYGSARDLVLGLEVVLADGRVLEMLGGLRKDNTGYDLKQLFVGSEGTLGVCTAATLKLFPKPARVMTAMLAVESVAKATALLELARSQAGEQLCALEWMSAKAVELTTRLVPQVRDPLAQLPRPVGQPSSAQSPLFAQQPAPIQQSSPVAVAGDRMLLEITGENHSGSKNHSVGKNNLGDPSQLLEDLIADAIEKGIVEDGTIATSVGEAQGFWKLRDSIPQAEKLAGGSIKHDVAVVASVVPQFMDAATEAVRKITSSKITSSVTSPTTICAYGHLGDGNIHFNLVLPAGSAIGGPAPVPADQASAGPHAPSSPPPSQGDGNTLSQAVYQVVVDFGGSFSAEHGIGLLHRETLARFKDPIALELMKAIKQTLDPQNILNPGKVL